MQNAERDLSRILQELTAAIEAALFSGQRCHIPFSVYSAWQPELFQVLVTHGIIKKERSKNLEEVTCPCGSGEQLPIQYHARTQEPFIQCFSCGDLRPIAPKELEYYESSPLHIARFLTKGIGDLEQPITLVADRAFFVGETPEDVMVYLAFGLNSKKINETLKCCAEHCQWQAFIILTSYLPSILPKDHTLLSLSDRKIYAFDRKVIGLDKKYLSSFFTKKKHNQEAAHIRWKNDPAKKKEQEITTYLRDNIEKWPKLNHIEIADRISSSKTLITYQDAQGQNNEVTMEKLKAITKEFLTLRGDTHRIFGHRDYISDTHLWEESVE